MTKAGRDHHRFKTGQFAGWQDYRYGGQSKPVSLAKHKPIMKAGERKAISDKVFAIVEDWRSSPFEHEGPCWAGLREALCLAGYAWRESDLEAQEIVGTAIQRLGFERPSIEEGQPEWSRGSDYCGWCHGPMGIEGMSRSQRFCSAECARMAITHRRDLYEGYAGAVLRSAQRLVTKSKAPPKPCAYCAASFQSDREDQMFCSTACSSRWQKGDRLLKDIVCEGCGKTAKPSNRGAKYCSQTCRSATHWNKERERLSCLSRQCQCCGKDYTPTAEKSMYCSARCGHVMACRAFAKRNPKPKAVHHFNCKCCGQGFATHIPWAKFCSTKCAYVVGRFEAGDIRRLTPGAFDYMLYSVGARITEGWREAA